MFFFLYELLMSFWMNFHKLLQERAESMVNAGRYRDHNLDLLLTKFEVRTVSFGQSFFPSDF